MCVLAQHPRPSAQSAKSLSDANKPPTLPSAASLEQCQLHGGYAARDDPSNAPPGVTLLSLKSATDLHTEVTDQHP